MSELRHASKPFGPRRVAFASSGFELGALSMVMGGTRYKRTRKFGVVLLTWHVSKLHKAPTLGVIFASGLSFKFELSAPSMIVGGTRHTGKRRKGVSLAFTIVSTSPVTRTVVKSIGECLRSL